MRLIAFLLATLLIATAVSLASHNFSKNPETNKYSKRLKRSNDDEEIRFNQTKSRGEKNSSSLPYAKSFLGFVKDIVKDQKSHDVEPKDEDLIEAADFGLDAMNELYAVKEPRLYSMGLYLTGNDPARFVAAFNALSDEARELTRFGYAALEATKKFRSKFPNSTSNLRQNFQSSLSQRCPKKGVPECPPASARYRTTDGSCNNLRGDRWWGSSMSSFQRFLPAVYEDGIDSVRRSTTGRLLPSAREISDYLHEERDAPLVSVSHMLMQWGQFVDHDLTATAQSRAFKNSVPQCCLFLGVGFQPPELMHPDCMPIVVDRNDRHLGDFDVRCLEFVRSGPAPGEDCEFGGPREQLNQVTSFLDASTVYSSTARQGDSLRIFRNGLMQYGRLESRRPLLPRQRHDDDSDLCKRGSLSTTCFKAGDGRLSEQPALISLHVVFLRLHNRLATQLAGLNSHWSDEKIFQESRKIVGALVQHVTYREFLPIVLGNEVMRIFDLEPLDEGYYKGHDQSVNPGIANAFAAAAFRFGHSLVQQSFVRYDKNHRPIFNNVTIHEEFSNPGNLETAGSVDRILLGLVNQPAQKRDVFISEELTNHLFQTPGFQFGMDLAAINIQRGRDHGIPPFVKWREPCVLSPVKNWKDLERIMSVEMAEKFKRLYDTVEDIDLFSAGLAEKPVVGGLVGPTFACIIAQQFSHLRKGDRFWYENPFPDSGFGPAELEQIRRVTLAQILCRTMENIESVQPFVMLMADDVRNQRLSCDDPLFDHMDLTPWIDKQRRGKVRIPRPGGMKPLKTKVTQNNRIFVQRPLGPHENLTIVVNNHAVNSPVFIRDSIYQSSFNTNPFEQHKPPDEPSHEGPPSYGHSPTTSNPFYPDPNNPNPPSKPGYNPYNPPNNEYPQTTTKRPANPYQQQRFQPSKDFFDNFEPNKSNRDEHDTEIRTLEASNNNKSRYRSTTRKPSKYTRTTTTQKPRVRNEHRNRHGKPALKPKLSVVRSQQQQSRESEEIKRREEEEEEATVTYEIETVNPILENDDEISDAVTDNPLFKISPDKESITRSDASYELPSPMTFKKKS